MIFLHSVNQVTLTTAAGFGLGGREACLGVFAGFADDAKMDNGLISLPNRPGIGFEAQNGRFTVMRAMA